MKIKTFVAQHIIIRLVGVLCFFIGVSFAWSWQTQPESAPTHFLVHLQPEAEKVYQNRNLSDYEFGGRTSKCNEMPQKEAYKCYSAARDFILKHWKDRKRA